MSGLTLPYVVFGPLSTGADVRLLATSKGLEVSAEVASELNRFYYAGWKHAKGIAGPYWAYIPLDNKYWGLAKAQVVGEGVTGPIFVVWMALLDRSGREAIGFRTPSLFRTAFPEPLLLPSTGSVVPTRTVRAGAATAVPSEFEPLLDRLAYSIHQGGKPPKPVCHIIPAGLGLDPAVAVAATLERLGVWGDGRTYCTWAGVLDAGFEPRDGPFDILIDVERTRTARNAIPVPSTMPPIGWFLQREVETGIGMPRGMETEADYASELAEFWFSQHRGELVQDHNFSLFRTLAAGSAVSALAALRLLELVLPQLAAKSRAAAIDRFVEEVLPHVPEDASLSMPIQRVANLTLRMDAILRVSGKTIRALIPGLIGEDPARDLSGHLLDHLRSQWAKQPRPALSPARLAAAEALIAGFAPSREKDEVRDALLSETWHDVEAERDPIERRLAVATRPDELGRAYRRLAEGVRDEDRRRFARRYLPHVVPRVSQKDARDELALARRIGVQFDCLRVLGVSIASTLGDAGRRGN